jgi:putative exporter of polyketide antibiotics
MVAKELISVHHSLVIMFALEAVKYRYRARFPFDRGYISNQGGLHTKHNAISKWAVGRGNIMNFNLTLSAILSTILSLCI